MGDMERMAATALCDKNDPTRLTWREVVIFERIQHIYRGKNPHKKCISWTLYESAHSAPEPVRSKEIS